MQLFLPCKIFIAVEKDALRLTKTSTVRETRVLIKGSECWSDRLFTALERWKVTLVRAVWTDEFDENPLPSPVEEPNALLRN